MLIYPNAIQIEEPLEELVMEMKKEQQDGPESGAPKPVAAGQSTIALQSRSHGRSYRKRG